LIIGGVGAAASDPAVEMLIAGGPCGGGGPHLETVQGEMIPAHADWQNMAASYVACDTGGGSVYVTGGKTDGDVALDDVWCFRDAHGADGHLVHAGHLGGARQSHSMVTVDGPDGPRLFIAGGFTGDGLGETDMLLVPVDGCSCTNVD